MYRADATSAYFCQAEVLVTPSMFDKQMRQQREDAQRRREEESRRRQEVRRREEAFLNNQRAEAERQRQRHREEQERRDHRAFIDNSLQFTEQRHADARRMPWQPALTQREDDSKPGVLKQIVNWIVGLAILGLGLHFAGQLLG